MHSTRQNPRSVRSADCLAAAQRAGPASPAGSSEATTRKNTKEALAATSQSLHQRRKALDASLRGLRFKRVRLRFSDFQPASFLNKREQDILQLAEMAALRQPQVERVTSDSICVLYLEAARPSAHELSIKPNLKEPLAALDTLEEESRSFLALLIMHAAGQELSWWVESDLSTRFGHVSPVSARRAASKTSPVGPSPLCSTPHPRSVTPASAAFARVMASPTTPISPTTFISPTTAKPLPPALAPPALLPASVPKPTCMCTTATTVATASRTLRPPPIVPPPLARADGQLSQSRATSDAQRSKRSTRFSFLHRAESAHSYQRLRDAIDLAQAEKRIKMAQANDHAADTSSSKFTFTCQGLPLLMGMWAAAQLYSLHVPRTNGYPTGIESLGVGPSLLASVVAIIFLVDAALGAAFTCLGSRIEPCVQSTYDSLGEVESHLHTGLRACLASIMSCSCQWATAYFQHGLLKGVICGTGKLGRCRLGIVLTIYICWPGACLAILLLLPQELETLPTSVPQQLPAEMVAAIVALPFVANAVGHVPILAATLISILVQRVHLEDLCMYVVAAGAAISVAALTWTTCFAPVVAVAATIIAMVAVLATASSPRSLLYYPGRWLRRCPVKLSAVLANFLVVLDVLAKGDPLAVWKANESTLTIMLVTATLSTLTATDCVQRVVRRSEYLVALRRERMQATLQKRVRSTYTRLNEMVRTEHFQSLTCEVQRQLLQQAVSSRDLPQSAIRLVHEIMLLKAVGGAVVTAGLRGDIRVSPSDREGTQQASRVADEANMRTKSARQALEGAEAAAREVGQSRTRLAVVERRAAAQLHEKEEALKAQIAARHAAAEQSARAAELLALRLAEEETLRVAMEGAAAVKAAKEAAKEEALGAVKQLELRFAGECRLQTEAQAAWYAIVAVAEIGPAEVAAVEPASRQQSDNSLVNAEAHAKEETMRSSEAMARAARIALRAVDDKKRAYDNIATAAKALAKTAAAIEVATREVITRALEVHEAAASLSRYTKIHSAAAEAKRVALLAEQTARDASSLAKRSEEAARALAHTCKTCAESAREACAIAQTVFELTEIEVKNRRLALETGLAATRAAQSAAARAAEADYGDAWDVRELSARVRAAGETARVAEAAEVEAEVALEKEESARAHEEIMKALAGRATRALEEARVEEKKWKHAMAMVAANAAQAEFARAQAETSELAESSAELRAAAELARAMADEAAEAVKSLDIASLETAKREVHLGGVRIYLLRHARLLREEAARAAAEASAKDAATVLEALEAEELRGRGLKDEVQAGEAQARLAASEASDTAAAAHDAMKAAQQAKVAATALSTDQLRTASSTAASMDVAEQEAHHRAAQTSREKLVAATHAQEEANKVAVEAKARWDAWVELDKAASAAAADARQFKIAIVLQKHEIHAAAFVAAKEATLLETMHDIYTEMALGIVSEVSSTLAHRLLLSYGPVAVATMEEVTEAIVQEVAAKVAVEAMTAKAAERLLAKLMADEVGSVAAAVVKEERLHGYEIGQVIYYCGYNENRYNLLHGAEGQVLSVVEPNSVHPPGGERLICAFGHHTTGIVFDLSMISPKPPPPLAGGYRAGEEVIYLGRSTLRGDGQPLRGMKGEVIGPARGVGPCDNISHMVTVRFQEGDRDHRKCYVSSIGRRLEAELPPAGSPLRDSIDRSGSRKF